MGRHEAGGSGRGVGEVLVGDGVSSRPGESKEQQCHETSKSKGML